MKRMTFVFVLLLGGCEIVEEETAPPDHSGAVARCNQLITTVCFRTAGCGPLTVNDCQVAIRRELDCRRAVGTAPTFGQCLGEVQSASCAALTDPTGDLVLPVSCVGAVLVR